MKNLKAILISVGITIVLTIAVCSLVSWARMEMVSSPVNYCGQTMEEANNPVNWHNGVYSPEGCDIIK